MASYGIKYQSTFDRVDRTGVNVAYTLQILQKDYSGSVTNVKCSGVPVVQSYQADDPKAPIKGSSLAINLINENNSLPLESFLSNDDDEYQVQFFWETQLMWIGFLVQDDCSETLVDFTHEINLSANDNLGLLKGITLDKAKYQTYVLGGSYNATVQSSAPHVIFQTDHSGPILQPGDQIIITGTAFDGTYTVTGGYDLSILRFILVAETLPTTITPAVATIAYYTPDMYSLRSLLTFLHNCFSSTNIEIDTHIFCNFFEVSQDTSVWFGEQTFLDPQTFLKDAVNFDDLYTVLTKILTRFNCTLFQAKGFWNIVHWDELRYDGYPVPGWAYDSDFSLIGPFKLNNESMIFAGFNKFLLEPFDATDIPDFYPQNGIQHRALRPFLYTKETFNFKQPAQLFRNFDLQTLGDLLSTSTTGSGPTLETINEYTATWFDASTLGVSVTGPYFIRVTLDNLNNEIDRVLVVEGDCKSQGIPVSAGDAFKYSFSFKTQDSQPGNINLVMIVELWDGTTQNFYHEDGTWTTSVGFVYNIPSGDNSNQWHSVTIDSTNFPIPYDGLLYCYLRVADLSAPIHETYYKDIRLEYVALINESTKIIGQTHQSTRFGTIKQNDDIEIFVDSSPKELNSGDIVLIDYDRVTSRPHFKVVS